MIKEERDWIFGVMRKPQKTNECIVILSSDEDDEVGVKMEQPMDVEQAQVASKEQERVNEVVESEDQTIWIEHEESSNSYNFEYSYDMYENASPEKPQLLQQEKQPQRVRESRQNDQATPNRPTSNIKLEPSPSQSAKRVLLQKLAEKIARKNIKTEQ